MGEGQRMRGREGNLSVLKVIREGVSVGGEGRERERERWRGQT